jgi:hypothetical protein
MPSQLEGQQLYINAGGSSVLGGNSVQLNPYGFYVNSSGAGMFSSFNMGGSGANGSDGNGGWNFNNYYINLSLIHI